MEPESTQEVPQESFPVAPLADPAVEELEKEEEEVASLLLASATLHPAPAPDAQSADIEMGAAVGQIPENPLGHLPDTPDVHVPIPALTDISETANLREVSLSPALSLPADIEHILSLGANEPEEDATRAHGFDRVVRDLKARAGFALQPDEGGEELASIEKEMEVEGVHRVTPKELTEADEAVKVEDNIEVEDAKGHATEDFPSDTDAKAPVNEAIPVVVSKDDTSSDSDSSNSSASSSSSSHSTASTRNPQTSAARRRTRKRPTKPAADSDLSDDDVNQTAAPTTAHELPPHVPDLPAIEKLGEEVAIAPFGKVESLVGTVVVVKADTAGDYRVLDEGTVVCWEDRVVAGTIFETFGAVQQPYYALRFPATSPPSPEIFTLSRPMFYAPSGAAFVFTRELRNLKGSDASNVWDEEVGPAEIEWSDDEAEQAYKRNLKADRRSRTATPAAGQPSGPPRPAHLPQRPANDPGSYAPLSRPRDLHLIGSPPPDGGRAMFERDTGRPGAGAEFEFSDDDEPAPSIEMREQDHTRGRGRGAPGRGRGRGRGRDEQRGGGWRPSQDDRRGPVAPLPVRPAGAGLPPRPSFDVQPPPPDPQGYSAPPPPFFDFRAQGSYGQGQQPYLPPPQPYNPQQPQRPQPYHNHQGSYNPAFMGSSPTAYGQQQPFVGQQFPPYEFTSPASFFPQQFDPAFMAQAWGYQHPGGYGGAPPGNGGAWQDGRGRSR